MDILQQLLTHAIEQARHQWLNIGSVIFLLIVIPIRNWTRNIALDKIKSKFEEDEYIVIEPKPPFAVDFFAPLLLGGSILEMILEPTVSSNSPYFIQYIILVKGISILFLSLVLFALFIVSCTKFLLTNKRLFIEPSFDFMYKLNKLLSFFEYKFLELKLTDIDDIKNESFYWQNVLKIETKNGEQVPRLVFDNMNEIKLEIDKQCV